MESGCGKIVVALLSERSEERPLLTCVTPESPVRVFAFGSKIARRSQSVVHGLQSATLRAAQRATHLAPSAEVIGALADHYMCGPCSAHI